MRYMSKDGVLQLFRELQSCDAVTALETGTRCHAGSVSSEATIYIVHYGRRSAIVIEELPLSMGLYHWTQHNDWEPPKGYRQLSYQEIVVSE